MATSIYAADGTEYRVGPRPETDDKGRLLYTVQKRLPSGRWQVVGEPYTDRQDATARVFKLRSAAEKVRK